MTFTRPPRQVRTLLGSLLSIATLVLATGKASAEFIWLEGEGPASITPAAVKPNVSGWGHTEFLSSGKWLHLSLDPGQVEATVPTAGVHLVYPFQTTSTGPYAIWDRIGYEFVRSPFAWRVDNGDWQIIQPTVLTTDLEELQDWNEVAWLKLGTQQLGAGSHTLEIRLTKEVDKAGKTDKILYASDAICITNDPFVPSGALRPGQERSEPADREAADKIFMLPPPRAAAGRSAVPLQGAWQVTRNDEDLPPANVATPMQDLPAHPHWGAIPVPSDKNESRPDLLMAHRLWYRTRVQVPGAVAGRAFTLKFPQNNLNTTVLVNGVYCGFNKNPFAPFAIDVTRGIRAGVNEVWVGIRDAWYGYTNDPKDPMALRRQFNLPLGFSSQGFQRLAYPIWGAFRSGILVTPVFESMGAAYAEDVFVKPSVARKSLAVDFTIRNSGPAPIAGDVAVEAIDSSGKVAHTFAPVKFQAAAGAAASVAFAQPWTNPALWWPDAPAMYSLRVTVSAGGKPIDVSETQFGYREWSIEGTRFLLNGIPFHGWHDTGAGGDTAKEWLARHRARHEQMMRFWGTSFLGMPPEQALSFFDKNGVVVRRQGMLDGEGIGYMAIEENPHLKVAGSDIKQDLMANWRDQVVAQVKGERNHPSVMLWSIENEWLFINCINLYGGLMDQFEAAVTETARAVQEADPTRPLMSDGGGATVKQTLPVHGNHYIDGPLQAYPALAYEANVKGGGRGRWVWDQKRPRFVGEDWYSTGNHPELAILGGEEALTGKLGTLHPNAIMGRMLTEGYRWAEYGAWDLYFGAGDADSTLLTSYQPRAAFCRQWDWSFKSGQVVPRTVGIFNDTRFADPITFKWTLDVAGKPPVSAATLLHVPPGTNQKLQIALPMPKVAQRTEGRWTLTLLVGGTQVFQDIKNVSVLPAAAPALKPGKLAIYDPDGGTAAYLRTVGVASTPVQSLQSLPTSARVLLIGRDALTPAQSTSSALAAYAADGHTVVVLEQKNPLHYQGLPAEIATAENEGRTAFSEDLGHPAFRGLDQKDFFTWAPAAREPADPELVYRNAYTKPQRGARSLVECDTMLQNSAVVEVPAGKGVMLLSQLLMAEKLSNNATAQRLLANLLEYGASYVPEARAATVSAPGSTELMRAIDSIGLTYEKQADVLAAIKPGGKRIAIIEATPDTLRSLASNLTVVEAFCKAGGWILFHGLTPEGLNDYNKIVGFEHMIRPFQREKVTFAVPRNPLSAGIPTGDVVLYTAQPIFNWTSGNYVVSDEFTYVVDYDEVAPFAKSAFSAYPNIVNGFTNADGWPLIINAPVPASGPLHVELSFPRPQAIREFTWVSDLNYWPTTHVSLVFDGRDKVGLATAPNGDPQVFPVQPPRAAAKIDMQIDGWTVVPGKGANIGIDNIYLKAARSPEFYKQVRPLLNVGGLMEYPRGGGGMVLCNLNFKANEDVPENAGHKRNVLAGLLRNLHATFSGGRSVIAGAGLQYSPIDISKAANQYRTERGWFGDAKHTFADLPTGSHAFAGVPYSVYDFATSPVPTAIMLGGTGVPGNLPMRVDGIPVDRKADALFFLHTARLDTRRSPDEVKQNRSFDMFEYIVTYSDGQTARIPVRAEIDVDDYRQHADVAIPGAQVAWLHKFGAEDLYATAYSMQWNNPRPAVPIKSIGMAYGPDRRGVPALLAVTAASLPQ